MEEQVNTMSTEAFGMELSGIVGMSENTEEGRKNANKSFNEFLISIGNPKQFQAMT